MHATGTAYRREETFEQEPKMLKTLMMKMMMLASWSQQRLHVEPR
jgi:hypothetical protein